MSKVYCASHQMIAGDRDHIDNAWMEQRTISARDLQLKGWCPENFLDVPAPTHLIRMAESPPQHEVKFSRVQIMTRLFDSAVLKQRQINV